MKYRQALRQFTTWATGNTNPEPEDAMRLLVDAGRVGARQLALGWRDAMLEQGKATGTVAGLLSALASLVTACRHCGLVDWHLEAVQPKVEPRHDRSGPPRHEVERLIEHLEVLVEQAKDRNAVRDLAVVRLLHNAALRRNEVRTLRIRDVELDHEAGPRVNAKRKRKREREWMLIGPKAAASLRAWLEQRGKVDRDAPVFVAIHCAPENPGPISGESIRLMLRTRARRAGLKATVRPHGLRHSAATHCARHASLAALKRLGGWTTLSSPSKYLDRDDQDRQQALSVVEC